MSNIIKVNNKIKVREDIKEEIISLITNGDIICADDITNFFPDISLPIAIELLLDDNFYNSICNNSLAKLKLSYHAIGLPRLVSILASGDNKDSMSALDRISRIIGAISEERGIKDLILEELLEERREHKLKVKSAHPPIEEDITLEKVNGNIFEVRETNIHSPIEEYNFLFEEE